MKIVVGSGNPVKREATLEAISGDPTVELVSVGSGVSEQPTGHDETRRGAENRARNAFDAAEYDLGVGIEGGVAQYQGTGDLYLVMWAAITDGDQWGFAAGPSIPLPASIAARVQAGEELGPVMDDRLGMDDVARKQGAAGVLTGGRLDRTEALATAVAGALGPFVADEYEA